LPKITLEDEQREGKVERVVFTAAMSAADTDGDGARIN
jgi:hypothetical protein